MALTTLAGTRWKLHKYPYLLEDEDDWALTGTAYTSANTVTVTSVQVDTKFVLENDTDEKCFMCFLSRSGATWYYCADAETETVITEQPIFEISGGADVTSATAIAWFEHNATPVISTLAGTTWQFNSTISITTPQASKDAWALNGVLYNDDASTPVYTENNYCLIFDSENEAVYCCYPTAEGIDELPCFLYDETNAWRYAVAARAVYSTTAPVFHIAGGTDATSVALINWFLTNATQIHEVVDDDSLKYYTSKVKNMVSASSTGTATDTVGYITINGTEKKLAGGSSVSVSATGTATDTVSYITIDGVEKKLAGGGAGTFYATWGTTTYADVLAAYNEGKAIYAKFTEETTAAYIGGTIIMALSDVLTYSSGTTTFAFTSAPLRIGDVNLTCHYQGYLYDDATWDTPTLVLLPSSLLNMSETDLHLFGTAEGNAPTTFTIGSGLSVSGGVITATGSGGAWGSYTLEAADWPAAAPYIITATVSGITATSKIVASPDTASMEDALLNKVYLSGQAANSITFTAETKPTNDIVFNFMYY